MSDLTELPAFRLRELLDAREVGAFEVAAAFYDRVVQANDQVNAIVSLRDRDAVLDEARGLEGHKGALAGLPIAVKDLVNTKGLRSTHGSPIFKDLVPEADDLIAGRMREAGALFIGKTNTPEFGLGSHSYNPVNGVTRNPYDHARSGGGSSGGAAVALACRMLPVADGSDMMGSLRNPAGWNNVYGLRPSYGMVPRDHLGDAFHTQLATLGPMAWHPRDLRLLLDVMAVPDALSPHPAPVQRETPKVIRWIGDWGGHLPMEEGVLALCEASLAVLEELGFRVEVAVPKVDPDALWLSWINLRSWLVADGLGAFLDKPETRDLLKPEAVWEIERGRSLSAMDIQAASLVRSNWFREVERADVLWALPTAQMFPFPAEWHWPKDVAGVAMDTYHRWMEVVIAASLIGVPAIGMPAGFRHGLPMGVQLFGPRGVDHGLIDLAERYFEATDFSGVRPD